MLVDIQAHPSCHEVIIRGDLPTALQGQHHNLRGLSYAGCINHAVDLLIAHRFETDLHAIHLRISGLDHAVLLDTFLSAGGFDEALTEQSESIVDFRLRLFEIEGKPQDEKRLLAQIFAKPMSYNLESKLLLRQGKVPNETSMPVRLVRETQPLDSMEFDRIPVTMCVTFGDIDLASQFVRSLNLHCSLEADLHLVACCYRVPKDRILQVIEEAGNPFASVKVLPEAWGHSEGKSGRLGSWYIEDSNRHGVSWGRCVLHRAAALFSPTRAMWILDDDIEFSDHSLEGCQRALMSMEEEGLLVGIGAITGDAPIPAAYIVRTQVIDFFFSSFLNPKAGHLVPQIGQPFHDMHHDLSTSRTDHLEFPLGVHIACTSAVFNDSVLHGQSITRPTHCEWRTQDHIRPRGGNTLVFGIEPLLRFTNMAPKLGGIMCRRGDTLWAKRIEQMWPGKIGNVNLSLTQSRNNSFTFGSLEELRGDIIGSMLARTIGCENPSGDVLIHNVMNREARLISNLTRVVALLQLMGYDGERGLAIKRLLEQLVNTPWPTTIHDDAVGYLSSDPNDEEVFQSAWSVN